MKALFNYLNILNLKCKKLFMLRSCRILIYNKFALTATFHNFIMFHHQYVCLPGYIEPPVGSSRERLGSPVASVPRRKVCRKTNSISLETFTWNYKSWSWSFRKYKVEFSLHLTWLPHVVTAYLKAGLPPIPTFPYFFESPYFFLLFWQNPYFVPTF